MPEVAMVFGSDGSAATAVDLTNPLPTRVALPASGLAPLAGTTSASAAMVGPFTPQLARPIWLTLSGTWTGTVQMLRSTDGGATQLPLTIAGSIWGAFTGNCNEPVWEESEAGATFYLSTAITSGMLTYRVAQ